VLVSVMELGEVLWVFLQVLPVLFRARPHRAVQRLQPDASNSLTGGVRSTILSGGKIPTRPWNPESRLNPAQLSDPHHEFHRRCQAVRISERASRVGRSGINRRTGIPVGLSCGGWLERIGDAADSLATQADLSGAKAQGGM
jgi:hypothetical protein